MDGMKFVIAVTSFMICRAFSGIFKQETIEEFVLKACLGLAILAIGYCLVILFSS